MAERAYCDPGGGDDMGSGSSDANRKRKHGGARKKLTWQQKLALCDPYVVASFLSSASCTCTSNCFQKFQAAAHGSVQMICDLRTSRTTGDNENAMKHCTQPHHHKTAARKINCHRKIYYTPGWMFVLNTPGGGKLSTIPYLAAVF